MIRITVPLPRGYMPDGQTWKSGVLAGQPVMFWEAFPKQEEALASQADEILYGGARGGGKTAAGMAWLCLGNPSGDGRRPSDSSYLNHPGYRALVLRKNLTDMSDWVAKAKVMFGPLGGEYLIGDNEFRFPSGATVVIGHLDSADAYEKYQGQEFVRILLEEATQIPDEVLYLKVRASNRTPFKDMRPQTWLTANPGGPGTNWVSDRFVAHGAGILFTDPATGTTRIYIPARVYDNPVYAQDKQYLGILLGLPPAIRRAWLDGDWTALQGQAFEEFRLAPLAGEPPNAQHVVQSANVALAPWFHRWLSCDWGYTHDAAVYKICRTPSGQVHFYDELVMNKTTPEELGVEIARFCWDEVKGREADSPGLILYLSHDAFDKRSSERTIADQIKSGIDQVFGADAAYIPSPEEVNAGDIMARSAVARSAGIVIQRAPNQRVAGWMYIRSMLRWLPLLPDNSDKFDATIALRLYQDDFKKFQEYLRLFQTKEEVALPVMQIHGDKCPSLLRAIPLARFQDPTKGDPNDIDKKHFQGMDCLDAWRYGAFATKFIDVHPPFEEFYSKRLGAIGPVTDGNSKVQIARKAEADYKKKYGTWTEPINFHRSGVRARRAAGPQSPRV